MRRALPLTCLALVLPFILAMPLAAHNPSNRAEAFKRNDQRLQDIGWKLARANAPFCIETQPAIGLQLQDAAIFGKPRQVRAALNLNGSFSIQTTAQESPANRAGAFAPNREVRLVGTLDPNDWPAGDRLDWRRLARLHNHIDHELARARALEFTFGDGKKAIVTAEPICSTRFELAGSGDRALADGMRVVIGTEFDGFKYSNELLAAAIAHELAHNLLGHREWLDRNGRARRNVRATEREADRLMPWLLGNAGYAPESASHFLKTFKPPSGRFLFLPGSHDDWRDRAQLAGAEAPRIRTLLKEKGSADWATHFRREIGSDGAN